MKHNPNATVLDLYDMVSPTTPMHVNTAWAIELHRREERKAVMFSPESEKVVV